MRDTVSKIIGTGLAAALLSMPVTASAQRDPAYTAARSAGIIGEKSDGYLGTLGGADADTQRMVEDLNIKRKAVYTREAQEQNATVQEVAFVGGCKQISRTVPGEKYQDPNGNWQTRTAAPPQLSPRCP
ncbi:MAG: YdbL family protein [Blastomonas sp.]